MRDCGVCLGGYDGERADFCDFSKCKARKQHQCYECQATIQPKEIYERVTGRWDGEFKTYHFCLCCSEIHTVFSCGEGRTFGALWDEMEEYVFSELTTANKCFVKLSPPAKAFLLKRWNDWKFSRTT